jgi:hypothetical protein
MIDDIRGIYYFSAHRNPSSYIVSGRYDPRMLDDLVANMKGFIMKPSETFVKTREKSLGAAYQYYIALLVIFTVLFGIVAVSMGVATFTNMLYSLAKVPVVGNVIAGGAENFTGFVIALHVFLVYLVFLAALIGIFVAGLLNHVFVLMMDGKKGVEQTLKTTMYASTPTLLLGWIPFVGILGYIWTLVLLVLGFKETQDMKIEFAALVVLVPIVLLLILVGLGSTVILAFMDAAAALLPKTFM